MGINRWLSIICLFQCLFVANAQQKGIDVSVSQKPANVVLLELSRKYGFEVSFNDADLAKYPVTLKGRFPEVEGALAALLSDLPFGIEKSGAVYVVFYDEAKAQPPLLSTLTVRGKLVDALSGEVLPYGTVNINGELRIADLGGNFSFVAFADEALQIRASHLGFMPFDTLVASRPWIECRLAPTHNVLAEATVVGTPSNFASLMGHSIGQIKMDPRMADFLPGADHNAISQLITSQPGIQRAGSSYGHMSMWGSYPGQNLLTFDGMTVFTYPFSSELLYPVSTMWVKHLRVEKGALGAADGDRVGGLVEIIGIDGRTDKVEAVCTADATAVGGLVTVPVSKSGALVASARHTWLPSYFDVFEKRAGFHELKSLDVWKPYQCTYRDYYLKFSHQAGNADRFYVAAYGNASSRQMDFEAATVNFSDHETRRQQGLSLFYGHTWGNGVNTNVRLSGTTARWNQSETIALAGSPSDSNPLLEQPSQQVGELKMGIDNRFPLNSKQFVEAGIQLSHTHTSFDVPLSDDVFALTANNGKGTAYLRNHILASSQLLMDIGLRLDYTFSKGQLFFQPRIKGEWEVADKLKLNFNWGVYNQYLMLVPFYTANGAVRFLWRGADQRSHYQQSSVLALGTLWVPRWLSVKAEAYMKDVEGLSFYNVSNGVMGEKTGRSRSWGVDIFGKKEFGHVAVWQSASVGRTREMFDPAGGYRPSVFSRLYESKTTLMANFRPMKFGLTYVYGSSTAPNLYASNTVGSYRRLDGTAAYAFRACKLNVDVGATGYNLMDTANASSLYVREIAVSGTETLLTGFGGMPLFVSFFVRITY